MSRRMRVLSRPAKRRRQLADTAIDEAEDVVRIVPLAEQQLCHTVEAEHRHTALARMLWSTNYVDLFLREIVEYADVAVCMLLMRSMLSRS